MSDSPDKRHHKHTPSSSEKKHSTHHQDKKPLDRRPSFKDENAKVEKKPQFIEPPSASAAASSSEHAASPASSPTAAAAAAAAAEPAAPPLSSSLPPDVLAKVREWKVKQAAITQGKGKGKATSRTHNFKPPAMTLEALAFLDSQGARNAMLLYSNNSALSFADGKYEDFDDFADDD